MNRVVARLVLLYVEPRYLANACCAHSSFNSVTNSIQFLRSYVPIYRRLLRLYIMELYSGSYERQQPLLAKWSHVINEMRLFNGIMDSQQRAALSSIATFGRPDLLSVIVPEPHRTTRTICSKMLDHALSDKWEHPSTRLQTVAALLPFVYGHPDNWDTARLLKSNAYHILHWWFLKASNDSIEWNSVSKRSKRDMFNSLLFYAVNVCKSAERVGFLLGYMNGWTMCHEHNAHNAIEFAQSLDRAPLEPAQKRQHL